MYTFDSSAQPGLLLLSLGVGFALGLLYDLFRTVRLIFFERSAAAVVIFDILYFAVFGLLSFVFILALNKGEVRLYIILAELAGAAVYYFSFGAAAIRLTDAFLKFFRRVCAAVSLPFKSLNRVINSFGRRISKKIKKNIAGKRFFLQKYLKKIRICVYNLVGVFYNRKIKDERNKNHESEQQKEKVK